MGSTTSEPKKTYLATSIYFNFYSKPCNWRFLQRTYKEDIVVPWIILLEKGLWINEGHLELLHKFCHTFTVIPGPWA